MVILTCLNGDLSVRKVYQSLTVILMFIFHREFERRGLDVEVWRQVLKNVLAELGDHVLLPVVARAGGATDDDESIEALNTIDTLKREIIELKAEVATLKAQMRDK